MDANTKPKAVRLSTAHFIGVWVIEVILQFHEYVLVFNALHLKSSCVNSEFLIFLFGTGLHCLPSWQKISSAVHFPQEKQNQKSDGLLQLMSFCQIPQWAPQLHWSSCHVYSCKHLHFQLIINNVLCMT